MSVRPRRRKKVDGWRITGWVFLALLMVFALLPMVWMLATSLKTQFAALQYPPEWIPRNITLEQYWRLLSPSSDIGGDFLRYLFNSIWVSITTTVLGVIVAVPAAYAFSRFRFPGREFLFYSVLLRNMFPAVVFLMPLFLLGWRGYREDLGANPIEYITHRTGDWTIRFLLITLSVTPARKLLNQPKLARFRRMLGLFAFFYGCLHLTTWVWLDKFFDLGDMWRDVVKRRFITAGMTALLLIVPLAITSTAGWVAASRFSISLCSGLKTDSLRKKSGRAPTLGTATGPTHRSKAVKRA